MNVIIAALQQWRKRLNEIPKCAVSDERGNMKRNAESTKYNSTIFQRSNRKKAKQFSINHIGDFTEIIGIILKLQIISVYND